MSVLQRGSSIKVGDIDFISFYIAVPPSFAPLGPNHSGARVDKVRCWFSGFGSLSLGSISVFVLDVKVQRKNGFQEGTILTGLPRC